MNRYHQARTLEKRVKLYKAQEQESGGEPAWKDLGVGDINIVPNSDSDYFRSNYYGGMIMLMNSEEDGSVIFRNPVSTRVQYQEQGDVIILWTEVDGPKETFALSFMDQENRDDFLTHIEETKLKLERSDKNGDAYKGLDDQDFDMHGQGLGMDLSSEESLAIPPCEFSKLNALNETLQRYLQSKNLHDDLVTLLEAQGYIPKLIEIFHMCEDLENTDALHTLYSIFKTLFMLEKNAIFETMFSQEYILDIVGILEYDPSKTTRTPHREHINDRVQFKEVIPIANKELLAKIHQTFRVQYIKDILIPVPLIFDETGTTLSSFIFFNKVQIIDLIKEDQHFLDELFEQLTNDEVSDDKRKDIILLLKELCVYSQSLQPARREEFIKMLANIGMLQSIEQLLNIDDKDIQQALIDIVCTITECTPSIIRIYVCREASYTIDEDTMMLNVMISHLVNCETEGMSVILLQTLQTLLDPENMCQTANSTIERSEFLSFFYRHNMHVLTSPVLAVTATDELVGKDDFQRATVFDNIVNLLTFCVEHHQSSIKNYIVSKDMLRRVLVLLQSRHKFLALSALRFCRRIIQHKDDMYNKYIIVGRLFKPIVQAFLVNGQRYNLLNSAILELFQFILNEDIKSLVAYIVENHIQAFRDITYVDTFAALAVRYEHQNQEKRRLDDSQDRDSGYAYGGGGIIHDQPSSREKRDDRTMDSYEEAWFRSDDDDDELPELPTDQTIPPSTEIADGATTKPLSAKLKDVELLDNKNSSETHNATNGPSSPVHNNNSPITDHINSQPNHNSDTEKSDSVFSTNNKTFNNKPLMNNRLIQNKFQIKINSTISSLANHADELKNGDTPKTTGDQPMEVDDSSPAAKTKPLLGGLVDYPSDDDDEDEESCLQNNTPTATPPIENEVPISPAKKQRISSS